MRLLHQHSIRYFKNVKLIVSLDKWWPVLMFMICRWAFYSWAFCFGPHSFSCLNFIKENSAFSVYKSGHEIWVYLDKISNILCFLEETTSGSSSTRSGSWSGSIVESGRPWSSWSKRSGEEVWRTVAEADSWTAGWWRRFFRYGGWTFC